MNVYRKYEIYISQGLSSLSVGIPVYDGLPPISAGYPNLARVASAQHAVLPSSAQYANPRTALVYPGTARDSNPRIARGLPPHNTGCQHRHCTGL